MRLAFAVSVSIGLVAGGAAACGSFGDAEVENETDAAAGDASTAGETATATDANQLIDGAVPIVDGGDGGGDGGGPESCNRNPACVRVVFVTSAQWTPTALGGVQGAHARCNELAAAAGASKRVQGRQFRAWISDKDDNPSADLIHGTAAYVLPDGTKIANDWGDLTDLSLAHAIDMDEKGTMLAGTSEIWTATSAAGLAVNPDCLDWTSDSPDATAIVGLTTGTTGNWTQRGVVSACNEDHRIYCFED